ncbi:hypothetical protein QW71_31570 [Paenibacillus sp. IHB B 3415]|uniref:hypothetical protein n=1 Tax=Paenibacillus sp. IHB B 3415 TaxID=867080 RepID=UPI000573332B|nr:hypothetical protein [Paenibacillus sp. IHB B 3415]KHL92035.1 hypothetical protein QW71_31570 [Paenibacillus sp. IHB B 3415]
MIQVRYAKSAIENAEGMNHLWLQIAPLGSVQNARVQITLPAGLHRVCNLNGADEDNAGVISVLEPLVVTDLFIEIFTLEPIPCGMHYITVELSYKDYVGSGTSIRQEIPLIVVPEEKSGDIDTDEEVVRRIKELQLLPGSGEMNEDNEYPPVKLIRIDSSNVSEWEKKYRVEGAIE